MTNFYHSLLFRSYYICRRKKKKNFFRCFFVAKVRRVYKPEEIFSFSFQTKDVKFFYEKRSQHGNKLLSFQLSSYNIGLYQYLSKFFEIFDYYNWEKMSMKRRLSVSKQSSTTNLLFLTSVKLAADSTFFNEYSYSYLCRRSSLVCLIELDELYLVV